MNTNGDWSIAQHVTRLLEALESSPGFSEKFLNGDGSVIVTRSGFTFSEFEDRPEAFYPAPIDGEATGTLRVSSARHACNVFFERLERTPEASTKWDSGEYELVVRKETAELRRIQ